MEFWRTLRDEDKPHYPEAYEEQLRALAEDPQLRDFRDIRLKFKDAPHRPIYHFVRPDCSVNDPNGLCFWEGRWHLFYQALGPQNIHWGHTVSEDLIHWKDLPYAIYPKVEPYCFSGGTCVDRENHRVIAAYYGYTGYDLETGYKCGIVIATSSDPLLLNWTKVNDGRPVVPDADAPCWTPPDAPPVKGQKPYKVFDAYIWKEDGVYYLLTGGYDPHPVTGRRHRQCYLLKCTDDDLINWEFVKPFLSNDVFKEAGDDGACPYFVPIGEGQSKRLFAHFSHRGASKYLVGDYDSGTQDFRPFGSGRFTSGYGVMTAPSVFPVEDGSAMLIFNAPELHPEEGWGGVMALPRRVTLGGIWGDELCQAPLDMSSLHGEHFSYTDVPLRAGERYIPQVADTASFELVLKFRAAEMPGDLEVEVLRDPEGEEYTRVVFLRQSGAMYAILPYTRDSMVYLDASHACSSGKGAIQVPETALLPMEADEDLTLRIFCDKSTVEVFANDRVFLFQRAYPEKPDSTGISVLTRGKDAVMASLDYWEMRSIYPEE